MAIDRENVKKKARALSKEAKELADGLDTNGDYVKEKALKEKFGWIQAALSELSTEIYGPGDGESTEFSSFFTTVGQSVVAAQKQLDKHTKDYLASIRSKPFLLPSVFRIPKLSAEIRFSLEETSGKELNLVFYKQETQVEKLQAQRIQFEIVAAPPPVGAIREITEKTPILEGLIAPDARDRLFKRIQATEPAKIHMNAIDKNKDRVLVFPYKPTNSYYLALATTDRHGARFWRFATDPEPKLRTPLQYPRPNSPDVEFAMLMELMTTIQDAQADLIKNLRPE